MNPKKLAGLSEAEVVAEIRANVGEARQTVAIMVDAMALLVRMGRMKNCTDEEIFGDVFETLSKQDEIDVTTADGLILAVVIAEFAVRATPA